MFGIGIRVEALEEVIDDISRQARLSETTAVTLRTTLGSLGLPLAPGLVLDQVSHALQATATRLAVLLGVMHDIAWHGPQSLSDLHLIDPRDLRSIGRSP